MRTLRYHTGNSQGPWRARVSRLTFALSLLLAPLDSWSQSEAESRLRLTGVALESNGVSLRVSYPAGFTNRLEFYVWDDPGDSVWRVHAQTNSEPGSNQVVWVDPEAPSGAWSSNDFMDVPPLWVHFHELEQQLRRMQYVALAGRW